MSKVGFTISGIESIEKVKAEINDSFSKSKLDKIFRDAVEKAYQEAYKLCPIETGNMQGHLFVEGAGDNWNLVCNCEYASQNEYGWYGIPTPPNPPGKMKYKGGYRPFMRNGILKGEEYFWKQIMKEAERLNKFAK